MKVFIILCVLTFLVKSDGRRIAEDDFDLFDQGTTCNTGVNGIHYFNIPADSPNGPITLMHVQYNSIRGLPVSTTTYHDSMNKVQLVERKDNFRVWDCPQLPVPQVQPNCAKTFKMTLAQQQLSNYTAFDRGHMTPVNPYRFHVSAMDNTFYCVNNAPQEPYTNQNPWNTIEQTVLQGTIAGYVMTGLCEENGVDGVTEDGVQVPSCFWKLVCSKDNNKTEVVGFIGENSLYDKTNTTARDIRSNETKKVRSQAQVISRNGRTDLIQKAWTDAAKVLLTNREGHLAPLSQDCVTQLTLSQTTESKWTEFVKVAQAIEDQSLQFN